jgi:hypothetical protein
VLKSWTAGVAGPQGPARRRSLRLLEEMVALGPALRLPEPVRTRRGGLTVRLPRARAALYRFLPGSPAPPVARAPERLIEQIGQAAAEIHALTPRLTAAVTDRRPADGRLVRWMSGMLAVLPGLSSDGATELRAAVGPQLPALSAQMEWLLDLRRVLPAAGRHVLPHGRRTGRQPGGGRLVSPRRARLGRSGARRAREGIRVVSVGRRRPCT